MLQLPDPSPHAAAVAPDRGRSARTGMEDRPCHRSGEDSTQTNRSPVPGPTAHARYTRSGAAPAATLVPTSPTRSAARRAAALFLFVTICRSLVCWVIAWRPGRGLVGLTSWLDWMIPRSTAIAGRMPMLLLAARGSRWRASVPRRRWCSGCAPSRVASRQRHRRRHGRRSGRRAVRCGVPGVQYLFGLLTRERRAGCLRHVARVPRPGGGSSSSALPPASPVSAVGGGYRPWRWPAAATSGLPPA
jgi:hypothetical protein